MHVTDSAEIRTQVASFYSRFDAQYQVVNTWSEENRGNKYAARANPNLPAIHVTFTWKNENCTSKDDNKTYRPKYHLSAHTLGVDYPFKFDIWEPNGTKPIAYSREYLILMSNQLRFSE